MIITSGKYALACLAVILAGAGSAQAAAPTITNAGTVDLYFNPQHPGDSQFGVRIVATEGATAFEATGLPPDAVLNPATGWINGNRSTPGSYDVAVRATNRDGTGSAVLHLVIHPVVIGVRSSPGIFYPGEAFRLTLRYNAAMVVTGTPRLALVLGPPGGAVLKDATYVSGSGTPELVFQYAVAVDDFAPDGVQLLPKAPSGGMICDTTGLTASPGLPLRYFVSGITILPAPGVAAANYRIPVRSSMPKDFVANLER